jgi:ATP-dependent Clp protease ATP-binding subunit ClpA
MFERFTERARKVVVLAQDEARHFNHNYIGTEHLLLGLLREDEGVAAQALYSLNVALDEVREQVESIVGYGEEGTGAQAPFTPRAQRGPAARPQLHRHRAHPSRPGQGERGRRSQGSLQPRRRP